jgi:cytochrome P450
MELASFTPFDAVFAEDPFDTFRQLRQESPVHFVEGLGYLVSRYDDVVAVCRDPMLWSSRSGPSSVGDTPRIKKILASGYPRVDTLLTSDPPRHKRYRALVAHAFTPRRVALIEDRIQALTHELLDRFAGRGHVELVTDYAVPLPLTIIAEQLGVSVLDLDRFKRWSDDAVLPMGGFLSEGERERCAHSQVEMGRYFAALIKDRRSAPREDMLTDLVEARLEGERPLDVPEMISILRQFLVAGNETTTKLITSTVMLLTQNPDQLQLLYDDPALAVGAVEEGLRLESPVQTMFRTATVDTSLGDVEIPAGGRVVLLIGAANRDPATFPDPDRFDIRRTNARFHVALAHGEHYCIGAALARAEASIALRTLTQRLPQLRLAGDDRNDFRHEASWTQRGLKALYLDFDPVLVSE